MNKKSKGQITMCFYKAHEPLARVVRNKSALLYLGGRRGDTSGKTNAIRKRLSLASLSFGENPLLRRPLLVHANGLHMRLTEAYFGRNRSRSIPPQWDKVFSETDAMRAYPVLVLDSPVHGPCGVRTLSDLLP